MTDTVVPPVAEVTPAPQPAVVDASVIAAAPAADAAVTPAEVDYELVLPEGIEAEHVKFDDFKAFAKDLGLDPVTDKEKVQKLFDKSIAVERNFHTSLADKNKEIIDGWIAEAKADKDIGGDKFDENRALGKEALQKFGTPGLTEFLDASGLGNHPEILRFAHNVAKATKNDNTIVTGGAPAQKGGVHSMYDNPTSKHA